MNKYAGLLCLSSLSIALLSACGGGSSKDNNSQRTTQNTAVDSAKKPDVAQVVNSYIQPASLVDNSDIHSYRIAMIGNSHTSGLARTLKKTIETMVPGKSVDVQVLGSGFTDDLIRNYDVVMGFTQPQTRWTHLIIQGQKYSQSQSQDYSTTATEQWVAMARTHGATPVLFPEHAQRGNSTEGSYVYGIHKVIASSEPSCIAPVARAWSKALSARPELELHDKDGNHANAVGALLSALVFTQIITGESVDKGPVTILAGVEPQIQGELGQHAAQALTERPGCPI
ncbi:hypothetical protein [Pseudoalteromonas rubra]|uniref:hypothetical protein n=1 Tax=Pseudoalteromonas rubra TaxID=43658 RepID=UPI000F7A4EF6|nr:hypothetical protein [Pseudoalteromonas rubra]